MWTAWWNSPPLFACTMRGVSLRPPPSVPPRAGGAGSGGWLAAQRGDVSRRAMLKGRASELRELEGALADVRARGVTRAMTVLGAAGIGKTRLVRDFLANVTRAKSDAAPRVFRGNSPDQAGAYAVFARTLRARFGIVEGMDPEAAKAQVRAQVAAVLEDRKVGDVAYFLGQLLDLEFQDSPLIKAVEGDAQQLRSMRRAVIKGFLEADARRAEGTFI